MKSYRIKIKKITLHSVLAFLPLAFYLANLYRMTGNSATAYLGATYLVGFVGLFTLITDRSCNLTIPFLVFLLYGMSGAFTWLIVGNVDFGDVAQSLLLYGVSMLLLLRPFSYIQGAVSTYCIFLLFLYEYFKGSKVQLLLTSSSNYISVLLILTACLYYMGLVNERRDLQLLDLIPSGLCFFLSVWAGGRGGILSCGSLLVLTVFLYSLRSSSRTQKRLLLLFALAVVVFVFLVIVDRVDPDSVFTLGKFGRKGIDNSPRQRIWIAYLKETVQSVLYLFSGAPLSEISLAASYGGNLHNSFLQLHAYNGLIMFLVFVYLLARALEYYWRQKLYLPLILLLTLSMRGFTDKFIFGQYGMPIMLYLVLFPVIDRQRRRKVDQSESPGGEEWTETQQP